MRPLGENDSDTPALVCLLDVVGRIRISLISNLEMKALTAVKVVTTPLV